MLNSIHTDIEWKCKWKKKTEKTVVDAPMAVRWNLRKIGNELVYICIMYQYSTQMHVTMAKLWTQKKTTTNGSNGVVVVAAAASSQAGVTTQNNISHIENWIDIRNSIHSHTKGFLTIH